VVRFRTSSSRRQGFVRPDQNARSRLRSKLGIDATKKIPGEGFKRPWPPLIKMDKAIKAKVDELFRLK